MFTESMVTLPDGSEYTVKWGTPEEIAARISENFWESIQQKLAKIFQNHWIDWDVEERIIQIRLNNGYYWDKIKKAFENYWQKLFNKKTSTGEYFHPMEWNHSKYIQSLWLSPHEHRKLYIDSILFELTQALKKMSQNPEVQKTLQRYFSLIMEKLKLLEEIWEHEEFRVVQERRDWLERWRIFFWDGSVVEFQQIEKTKTEILPRFSEPTHFRYLDKEYMNFFRPHEIELHKNSNLGTSSKIEAITLQINWIISEFQNGDTLSPEYWIWLRNFITSCWIKLYPFHNLYQNWEIRFSTQTASIYVSEDTIIINQNQSNTTIQKWETWDWEVSIRK